MADDTAGEWVTVAPRSALKAGEVLGVQAKSLEIAVYEIDGALYATDNQCTHAFAFLSDGWLDGDVIECPLHGGRFEVKTGKGLGPPIPCDVKTFPVRVAGSDIQVKVDS